MKTFYLSFETLEQWDELKDSVPKGSVIDIIGVRYRSDKVGDKDVSTPLPGWHVNILASALPDAFEPFMVTPETPDRVFENYTEPPKNPIFSVTMAQCRLALYDLKGVVTDEEFLALADLLPEESRERGRLELRTRQTVERNHPLVVAFAEVNGWDLDELFEYASKL